MRIFLHICCAPCAVGVIEILRAEGHTVSGFFYNPNIYPVEEYEKRVASLERLAGRIGFDYVVGSYDTEDWHEHVQGLENEPENGERCKACYEMRLNHTAETAKARGYECLATTLTISPHKSASIIGPIGRRVGGRHGIEFLERDFKKRDGFNHSVLLSKEHGLYRQSYCGCEYSLKKRKTRNEGREPKVRPTRQNIRVSARQFPASGQAARIETPEGSQ
jgi:predicted adenine nucleotide alpha hydrolase (AANH) superfamily ATPase